MVASTRSEPADSRDGSAATSASRPPVTLARIEIRPSTSNRNAVPSRRRASAVACMDASTPRLSKASTAASHAGVAGMSDLVSAMKGDDATAQIVVPGLGETRGAEHIEQGFLIRMHADGFRQVAIARGIVRNEATQQRQHIEGIRVVQGF